MWWPWRSRPRFFSPPQQYKFCFSPKLPHSPVKQDASRSWAGISAPPCLRRVRALEQAGLIRGYHADLNAEELGYGLTVFVWIGLDSQHEDDLSAFEHRMAALPMIRECHMLTGEADFILKVVAWDWDAWQNFLTAELIAAPNVASVKTAPVLRCSKMEFGVPMDGLGES
ncbi:MAG: Lrp/AsnC family transcriptional regulator [Rhodospirillaceae bacterium]|nr:Lrp/AsnC family transcriptional regulator [Rhodospirillaceae bacterium]